MSSSRRGSSKIHEKVVPTPGKVLGQRSSARAHDDQVVEAHLAQVGPKALRVLVGDVYADLPHGFYRARVYLGRGVYASAVDLEAVTGQVPEEPLGHLA